MVPRGKSLLLTTFALAALSGCSLLSKPEPLEALPDPIRREPPPRPAAALDQPGQPGRPGPDAAAAMRRAMPAGGAAEGKTGG